MRKINQGIVFAGTLILTLIIVGDPVCVQQVTIVTLNLDCVQSLRNVHSRLLVLQSGIVFRVIYK